MKEVDPTIIFQFYKLIIIGIGSSEVIVNGLD